MQWEKLCEGASLEEAAQAVANSLSEAARLYDEEVARLNASQSSNIPKDKVAASLNISSSFEDEEDDDAVYDSDAYKDVEAQYKLTSEVLSFLSDLVNDPSSGFGRLKNDQVVSLIQDTFPDCFWANEIVQGNISTLRERHREVRLSLTKPSMF